MRIPKSFTIEPEINDYLEQTKGDRSASDRVNELLRRAMIQEQYQMLEIEAAEFFADLKPEDSETTSFRKASIRTFSKD